MDRVGTLAIAALALALTALPSAGTLAQDVGSGPATGAVTTSGDASGAAAGTTTAGAAGSGATLGSSVGAGTDASATTTTTATATTTTTTTDPGAAPTEPSLTHRYQVGLRVGIGVPFMFGLKYKDGAACDDEMQTWCRHFGVGMLDLDLGFGVSDAIEIFFAARFGLGDEEASHSAPLSLGLGMRAYGSPESTVKPYFGPRLVLDLTDADSTVRPGWKSVDFGVRADIGLQVDFVRYVGMYGQLGLTLSFLRALMFVPDLSIGLQVRLP